MPARLHVYFSGHVQGVGFRYTVRTLSLEFDVTGWVKNLRDGRVEMLTEGERSELEAFQAAIPDASSAGNAAGPRLLRDSFTAHMLAAGADVASVARLLGQFTVSAGSSGGERGDIAQLQAKYERAHPRSGLTCDRGADRGAQADGAEDRGPQQVQ